MAPAATPRGQRVAGWPTAGERAILAGWGVALNTYHRRRMIAAYRCISPWAVGFLVFVVGSLLASLFLSVSIGAPRECVNQAPRLRSMKTWMSEDVRRRLEQPAP